MRKTIHPDYVLLGTSLLLIILGFVVLAGVSITVSQKIYGNSFHYLLHQLMFGFIPGGILGLLAYKINPRFLKKISLPALCLILLLMIAVFVPITGTFLGGARRWVSFGPVTFQPSEFLKLFFIIYLAAWLTKQKKQKSNNPWRLFLPLLVILAVICALLIAQPDISTLVIIAAVTLALYLVADTPFYQSMLLFLGGIGGLAVLIKTAPYRLNRLMVFLRPDTQPLGIGYQIKQSLIAIGSGGILGRGLGLSVQKYGFLPQPMTDTIFAVFSEETGFVGAIILILLFLIFIWQGFRVARKCKDSFLRLIAIGIAFWLTFQALVNIGAIIGILPLTGIPLPFMSYGSSHLIVELIALGLLLNISKRTKRL